MIDTSYMYMMVFEYAGNAYCLNLGAMLKIVSPNLKVILYKHI